MSRLHTSTPEAAFTYLLCVLICIPLQDSMHARLASAGLFATLYCLWVSQACVFKQACLVMSAKPLMPICWSTRLLIKLCMSIYMCAFCVDSLHHGGRQLLPAQCCHLASACAPAGLLGELSEQASVCFNNCFGNGCPLGWC